MYVDSALDYQKAQANIEEHGTIGLHPRTSEPFENPYLRVRERASSLMLKIRLVDTRREPKPDKPAKFKGKRTASSREATVEGFEERLDHLRRTLLDLLVGEEPGSIEILRRRPAIEAEIWSCESQLAAAKNDHERAEKANAEAQRCQGEARRAEMLDAVKRLEELERRLGMGSEMGEELRRLAAAS